jgi:hypothetical protein
MKSRLRITQSTLAALGLVSILACSSGGGTPQTPPKTIADTLTYTNPTTGAYKLVQDTAASTKTHLVLDVVGTAGSGHGVSMIFTLAGTGASWSKVASTDAAYVQNVAFSLGTGTQMLVGKTSGTTLQIGAFQKRNSATAVSFNGTLAKIAIDLGSGTPVNTAITITPTKGSALMADGTLADLSGQVVAGTLVAN